MTRTRRRPRAPPTTWCTMALTTKQAVQLTAPELATVVDDARWAQAIGDADQDTPAAVLGAKAERAARYLVAHMLTMQKRAGATGTNGQVISVSVGPVSRTYAQTSATGDAREDWLRATHYGQEFLRITQAAGVGAFLVT